MVAVENSTQGRLFPPHECRRWVFSSVVCRQQRGLPCPGNWVSEKPAYSCGIVFLAMFASSPKDRKVERTSEKTVTFCLGVCIWISLPTLMDSSIKLQAEAVNYFLEQSWWKKSAVNSPKRSLGLQPCSTLSPPCSLKLELFQAAIHAVSHPGPEPGPAGSSSLYFSLEDRCFWSFSCYCFLPPSC